MWTKGGEAQRKKGDRCPQRGRDWGDRPSQASPLASATRLAQLMCHQWMNVCKIPAPSMPPCARSLEATRSNLHRETAWSGGHSGMGTLSRNCPEQTEKCDYILPDPCPHLRLLSVHMGLHVLSPMFPAIGFSSHGLLTCLLPRKSSLEHTVFCFTIPTARATAPLMWLQSICAISKPNLPYGHLSTSTFLSASKIYSFVSNYIFSYNKSS